MLEKKGVAIGYSGRGVPRILAIARGLLVEKLLRIAEENNITIYRDSDLAETLAVLNVGNEIPEDLFFAVCEVLAYCYRINNEFREKLSNRIY